MNFFLTPRILGSIVLFVLIIILVPWLLDGNQHYSYTHDKLTMPSGITSNNIHASIDNNPAVRTDLKDIKKADNLPHNTLADIDILIQKPDVSFSIAAPVWTLQVASFVNKDATLKLRDQLRLAGFRAYVRKVYSQNSKLVVYKAYVGPSFNASHLEKQIPILEQWKLTPQLVNFVDDIEMNL